MVEIKLTAFDGAMAGAGVKTESPATKSPEAPQPKAKRSAGSGLHGAFFEPVKDEETEENDYYMESTTGLSVMEECKSERYVEIPNEEL
ncbi:unnamed protein product [Cylicostephanus goldi]|uniref:Uncharacterized protein n=1 Tax=Cylicostephanus goldi TaxID=71465 RepID=A0A3P7QXZ3_CYLGO|nr:unnamed protein product [Cylicostephanus goldi]